jgi:hypothetical protein
MSMNIEFYYRPRDGRIFVRMMAPGEYHNVIERPATAQDQQTHARQWRQFRAGEEQTPEGIPIEGLYLETPRIAAKSRGMGVATIEQCASLWGTRSPTRWAAKFPVNRAKHVLAEANKGVGVREYRADIERWRRGSRLWKAALACGLAPFTFPRLKTKYPFSFPLNNLQFVAVR